MVSMRSFTPDPFPLTHVYRTIRPAPIRRRRAGCHRARSTHPRHRSRVPCPRPSPESTGSGTPSRAPERTPGGARRAVDAAAAATHAKERRPPPARTRRASSSTTPGTCPAPCSSTSTPSSPARRARRAATRCPTPTCSQEPCARRGAADDSGSSPTTTATGWSPRGPGGCCAGRALAADRVAVLDGGFAGVGGRGRRGLDRRRAACAAPGDVRVRRRRDAGARRGRRGATLAARDGVLLDARAAARYRGETEPVDPVAGHVPGAANLPAAELIGADGRWRAADELAGTRRACAALVDGGGAAPVGAYCGSGVSAACSCSALEHAGLRPPERARWALRRVAGRTGAADADGRSRPDPVPSTGRDQLREPRSPTVGAMSPRPRWCGRRSSWATSSPSRPPAATRSASTSRCASPRELGVLEGVEPARPRRRRPTRSCAGSTCRLPRRPCASAPGARRRHRRTGSGTDDNPIFDGHARGQRAWSAAARSRAAREIAEGRADRAVNIAGGLHHAMADHACGLLRLQRLRGGDLLAARPRLRADRLRRRRRPPRRRRAGRVLRRPPRADDLAAPAPADAVAGHRLAGRATASGRRVGHGGQPGAAARHRATPGWLRAFHAVVPSLLAAFRPQMLVTQCGADTHAEDPLADLRSPSTGTARSTGGCASCAERTAGGKWLALGGGGYGLFRVVPRSWTHLLATVLDRDVDPRRPMPAGLDGATPPRSTRAPAADRR